MTAARNADALIDAFLDEGVTDLPDRVFDSVRGEIHRARQRMVVGPVALPRSHTLVRLAIAAAVVVAMSVTWLNLGMVLGPGVSTPAPSATDSPAPGPSLRIVGTELSSNLEPGRWGFDPTLVQGSDSADGPTVIITIPSEGWTRFAGFAADKNYGPSDDDWGPSFVVWHIVTRYVNGCTDLTPIDPTPGGSVDDILGALASQPLVEAGPITDVTIDGYPGRFVEIRAPADISGCPEGFFPFHDKYAVPDEVDRVYAIDVDGFRLTFFARITPRTTVADLAELESIIDSIDIVP